MYSQIYEKYQQDKQLAEQMLLIPSQPPKYNFKRISEELSGPSSIAAGYEPLKPRSSNRIVDDPHLELTAS